MTKQSVSVDFFCGALKLLVKQHGDRDSMRHMEEIRRHLADIEMLYLSGDVIPKKTKRLK